MRPTITMKLLAAALLAATPLASQADGLRIPFTGSLEGGGRVVVPGVPGVDYTADYRARCGGGPVLETEAAGTTSLLGLVDDFQSHCLLPPEVVGGQIVGLPFGNGRFRFTDTKGRYIEGEYRGKVTPTVASKPPPAGSPPGTPPTGTWIIEGEVCISGASSQLHIANDCAANRYFPARGVTDPLNGTATIFINQTIGIRW